MSLFYRLNKKWRVTNYDYARSWLERGLTEAEFKIYPYTGETTCACDGIKASAVADGEWKEIGRAPINTLHDNDKKETARRELLKEILKAADTFEDAGIKCVMEGLPIKEYVSQQLQE